MKAFEKPKQAGGATISRSGDGLTCAIEGRSNVPSGRSDAERFRRR